ncbi:hypothetical protein IB229_04120 [Pseudomonas sp. PDM14]|uniref:hypothetical protein n=1 Tax=Pseudomonas sp. PDM14 TaxID=2769288 RepID=UPI001780E8F0|nr:hypothetical protein [Pseudomonas sp. PDM14]MBD9482143.1 hypothetical protein [Pseudomonas sp. PDM14]
MKHTLIFLAVFLPLFAIVTQGGMHNYGTFAFIAMLTVSYFISKYILNLLPKIKTNNNETLASNSLIPAQSKTDEVKKCCHCAETIKSEAEVCRYCGLDPDQEIMKINGITFDGEKYIFLEHQFSKRSDALKYAKLKANKSQ